MSTAALFGPMVLGIKAMLMAQLCPGRMTGSQCEVPAMAKLPLSAPLKTMLITLTIDLLLLSNVTDCDPPVLPAMALGKARLEADSVRDELPAADCVTVNVWPATVRTI